ncbi:MAG TPA: hypothetical protein VHQ42_07030 [Candidatus Limnocylindria bacterium]|nr:hypothetical protein [Candidatus Limnocylindria bacterium]
MAGRVVEGLVALGVLASAGILIVMLAAPFVPAPSGDVAATTPSVGPSAPAASSAEPGMPPLGLYELRGRLGVASSCLGLELGPQAYPVAAGAEGRATVFAWTSPVSDTGNPEACEGRVGDLLEIQATVTRVADEDDPDGPAVGYALRFHLPVEAGPGEIDQEIVILAAQSSSELIQALDMTTSGNGLVFERVAEIDPPLASPEP